MGFGVLACASDARASASPARGESAEAVRPAATERRIAEPRAQTRRSIGVPPANRLALLDSLLGIDPKANARWVEFQGGPFAQYESDFRKLDDEQWRECGPAWDCINYYDRAAIYYAWWRHTGNRKYLDRANAVAVDYRENYLEASKYGASFHWAMMDGVALHYLATGDTMSLIAVGKVADGFAYHTRIVGGKKDNDNRIQARILVGLLLAQKLSAPSTGLPDPIGIPGGNNWSAKLRQALTSILTTQDADGAWRFGRCNGTPPFFTTHPFTIGLLLDALARYHDLFEADPRILPAVQRTADYLWANDWLPRARAFKYLGQECPGEGGPTPAPDLNNLIVNGFAWVYHQTGNATYRQRADEIFAGALTTDAAAEDAKHFNQQYTSSLRYIAYRTLPPARTAGASDRAP